MIPLFLPNREGLNSNARIQKYFEGQIIHCKFCFNKLTDYTT